MCAGKISEWIFSGPLKVNIAQPLSPPKPRTDAIISLVTQKGRIKYLSRLTPIDKVVLEREFTDKNEWLELMMYKAQQAGQPNCSIVRPQLGTASFLHSTTVQKFYPIRWATVNKNVEWINYIYYNQQRFVNYTRDAVKGIAEQLGPASFMAWQNGMALGMLLAEKGGVCKMFGTFCCTFIPNGSNTKALEGLTETAGTEHPFSSVLERRFGKWSGPLTSLLISVAVAAAILIPASED